MKAEILIRNIQLEKLGIGKLSHKEKQIFGFLNENLSDLNIYTSNRYSRSLWYLGRNIENIVLKYDKISGALSVCGKFWSTFESKFNIGAKGIKKCIEWKINEDLKLDIPHYIVYGGIICVPETKETLQLEENLNLTYLDFIDINPNNMIIFVN